MTNTVAGYPLDSILSSCSSTSRWLFQRFAETQGPNAQSGGSIASPVMPTNCDNISRGVPKRKCTSHASCGSVISICPFVSVKTAAASLSTNTPCPSLQKKNGIGKYVFSP